MLHRRGRRRKVANAGRCGASRRRGLRWPCRRVGTREAHRRLAARPRPPRSTTARTRGPGTRAPGSRRASAAADSQKRRSAGLAASARSRGRSRVKHAARGTRPATWSNESRKSSARTSRWRDHAGRGSQPRRAASSNQPREGSEATRSERAWATPARDRVTRNRQHHAPGRVVERLQRLLRPPRRVQVSAGCPRAGTRSRAPASAPPRSDRVTATRAWATPTRHHRQVPRLQRVRAAVRARLVPVTIRNTMVPGGARTARRAASRAANAIVEHEHDPEHEHGTDQHTERVRRPEPLDRPRRPEPRSRRDAPPRRGAAHRLVRRSRPHTR